MLFNSFTFLAFFVIVLVGYYLLRSWVARKGMLLVASYVFYAAWNPPFIVLLWLSTVVDWLAARGIHASSSPSRRRLLMVVSLAANFGLLGYFKYGGFLLDNFVLLTRSLGLEVSLAAPDIVLPVGISFYTFQTLSYTLDVYRRRLAPPDSFLDYALYVTFFPQLVAGPIVRAADFLPQCTQPKAFSGRNFGWGLCLMLVGLFEKTAIADGILAPIVEAVYDTTDRPDLISAWCGTFAFAGQIFLDFAGYSLVAIGSALCFGFAIQDNFRSPYAAVGFSDFWGRWHVSLSSWLRDYLYIPLGGSHKGPFRTFASLMITMLLGGLWHGASWTFVIWGGLHGLYLIGQRAITRIVPWRLKDGSVVQLPVALLTFLLVCVAWVFFRAHSFGQAFAIAAALFGSGSHHAARLVSRESIVLSLGATIILFCVHGSMKDTSIASIVTRVPWWVRSLALAVMVLGILGLSGEDHAFIYFQF
jgi:alginate O-acetyltransferase complex protein AlgI